MLSVRGVRKSYSGVPALSDGSLEVRRGEIHALCGGNGAGKSTLLKILMGFVEPDGGEIRIRGARVHFASAREALDAGMAMVQQELSGVPDLTVAENIFLGAEPRRFGFVDFRRMERDARQLLSGLGCDTDPAAQMRGLSVATQQLVEIAKALSHRKAEILIFDEPTSAIGEADTARLFQALRELAAAGKAIILVTHRMGEIFEVADRYTVLKDGARVATGTVRESSREELIEQMVGMPLEREFAPRGEVRGRVLLEVRGLSRAPHFSDIGFTLRQGEVLGLYGRVGAGRSELLDVLYGLRRADAGSVVLDGCDLGRSTVAERLDAGMAYVTEERKRNGLVLSSSVRDNLTLSVLGRMQRWGFVEAEQERRSVAATMERLSIRAAGWRQPVRRLSGGNQQKVVFGRCLLAQPKLLLLDEPTRGVDVAAKQEIYQFVAGFCRAGGGVLVASSELEEILGLSHRIVVLGAGRQVAEFARDEATQKALLLAAD